MDIVYKSQWGRRNALFVFQKVSVIYSLVFQRFTPTYHKYTHYNGCSSDNDTSTSQMALQDIKTTLEH